MDSLIAIVPMTCVIASAIAAMTAEAFSSPGERLPIGGLGAVGLAAATMALLLLWNQEASSFGLVVADNFGLFVTGILIVIGMLSLGLSGPGLDGPGLPRGEYYALLLFATAGMMLLATAVDLLVMYLALEILSLSVYVLTGLRRESVRATEASFKYFLLGGFSSAFLLYGIALTYGVAGSTRLDRIAVVVAGAVPSASLLWPAVGLLIVGFAFKVSAVPFHMWTPDAYEGAAPVVAGFMSTGVKAAAFAAFLRLFLAAFEPLTDGWAAVVGPIALASMILGTFVGVVQTNVRRMLAYSSIAHAGYVLVALVAASDLGRSAVLFYLLAYGVANVGAFGVIAYLQSTGRAADEVDDYAGLAGRQPSVACLMAIFLLSLGGFPPLAGFIAKWSVFSAAVSAGYTGLAIAGVLTSVVSVFYYLRVIVMMYMTQTDEPAGARAGRRVAWASLVLSAVLVVYLGLLPARVLDWATASVVLIR